MNTLRGLSHEFLDTLFSYDPENGIVTRKISVRGRGSKCRAASIVGSFEKRGYLHVMIKGKFVLLHRLVYFLVYKRCPKYIDHKDCNKINNRIANLRPTTKRHNAGNTPMLSNNTSGFRGVSRNSNSGKWHAQIKIHGKQTYLGRFDTPEEAAQRYDRSAKKHFGKFVRTNYASRI